jgi:hypothetical protein
MLLLQLLLLTLVECVQQEERKLDKALRANPEDEQLNIRLGTVHEQLAALGADVAESKARRILHGLGFDEDMQVCVCTYYYYALPYFHEIISVCTVLLLCFEAVVSLLFCKGKALVKFVGVVCTVQLH